MMEAINGVTPPEPVYFKSLHLRNVKCFQGDYDFRLADKNGKSILWTVIIGNNNTGKTTLLKAIAGLELKILSLQSLEDNCVPNGLYFGGDIFGSIPPMWGDRLPVKIETSSVKIETSSKFEYYYDRNSALVMPNHLAEKVLIYAYGTSRRTTTTNNLANGDELKKPIIDELIKDKTELLNTEEWLLQTDYAVKNGNEAAKKVLTKIEDIFLKSAVLPDLKNIRFTTNEQLKSFVEVETSSGWMRLSELGYGYQVTIAWLADLAKKLFDRYPHLENPLHGPAIVLVDEIDLHLHPEWQRKIINDLSKLFPNVQFIVTAHSPLIVQSAENVNLIMLEKDDETGSINVRQQFGSFQGWTVEEILRELMDMGEKTRSDRYLELMRQFEDGLLNEDYFAVKMAYAELDKILSPSSHQRKVLQIQMSSLIPA